MLRIGNEKKGRLAAPFLLIICRTVDAVSLKSFALAQTDFERA
jgi:hypothetical protein